MALELAATPAAVAQARRALEGALIEMDVDEERRVDLRLVVSELIANAVQHGSREGDVVGVQLRSSSDFVEVVVSDAARGTAPRMLSGDTGSSAGRGLRIVDRLALEWSDEIHAGRRLVRCRLDLR